MLTSVLSRVFGRVLTSVLSLAGNPLHHRILEAAQDRGDRLVLRLDARDRDRPGDHAHGVGRVAIVLRLP